MTDDKNRNIPYVLYNETWIRINNLHIHDWMVTDEDLDPLGQRLNEIRHYPLLSRSMISNLSPISDILLKATLLGSNPAGLYKPKKM